MAIKIYLFSFSNCGTSNFEKRACRCILKTSYFSVSTSPIRLNKITKASQTILYKKGILTVKKTIEVQILKMEQLDLY